jgi:predicted small integral membrane protein
MLNWMHWTWQSGLGFGLLLVMLIGLTIFDRYRPGHERKGWLPMRTTRGDRVFIAVAWFLLMVFAWQKYLPDKIAAWVVITAGALLGVVIVWRG